MKYERNELVIYPIFHGTHPYAKKTSTRRNAKEIFARKQIKSLYTEDIHKNPNKYTTLMDGVQTEMQKKG